MKNWTMNTTVTHGNVCLGIAAVCMGVGVGVVLAGCKQRVEKNEQEQPTSCELFCRVLRRRASFHAGDINPPQDMYVYKTFVGQYAQEILDLRMQYETWLRLQRPRPAFRMSHLQITA